MRGYIQFLTATLIFVDQVLTIIYFAKNINTFADLSIKRTLIACIFIVPIFNLAFSLYYLYPNHEEVFSKHVKLFSCCLRDILVIDVKQFHKDFFQFKQEEGRQLSIKLKTLAIYIIFVPGMMIFWTYTLVKVLFVLLNFSISMLGEFSAMLAYGIYLAMFFWFRVMNCLKIEIIIECLGSSKYRLLDSRAKVKFFSIFIDGFQAIFQAFPVMIAKSINLSKLITWNTFSIISIGVDVLDILFQIINASLYKINDQHHMEEITHYNNQINPEII